MQILSILLSTEHSYFGHHGKPAGNSEMTSVDEVECLAGQGLRGDRFCGYKENYKGQITFFSQEVYERLCSQFKIQSKPVSVFRRNIITLGIDLNTLIGKRFELQAIQFEGMVECSPCYWMDQAFCPGAEAALKGWGGLRAKIVSDGILSLGSAELKISC